MKLLIIAHNLSSGGAATACRRLIGAFENSGIQVDLLTIKESKVSNSVTSELRQICSSVVSRIDLLVCKLLNNGNQHWQSSGLVGVLKARNINHLSPTAVNIHWIGHATISIRQLKKLNVPIIITMHDEWWLSAIDHYDTNGIVYARLSVKKLFIKLIFRYKMEFLNQPNVKIVSPNSELKLRLEKFLPFKIDRIYVIPNPISSKVFYPRTDDKKSKKVLLYAGGTQDSRKGYDLLLSVLDSMRESCQVRVLGKQGVESSGVNKQITITGYPRINSEEEMNQIYSESSITVVPSRQEAFGQVASESLMAGTPVISFAVGGLKDIVKTGMNGYLVQSFDTHKMAELIDNFLQNNDFDSRLISEDARMRFSEAVIVEAYLAII